MKTNLDRNFFAQGNTLILSKQDMEYCFVRGNVHRLGRVEQYYNDGKLSATRMVISKNEDD